MKKIKKDHSNAGQSNTVKKPHKHDANVQKNTMLYFQVGLILCLLATYTLFEMQFETKITNYDDVALLADDNIEATPEKFKIYKEPVAEPKPEPVKKKKLITNVIKQVDNDHKEIESKVITQEQNTTSEKPADIGDIVVDEGPEEVPVIPFSAVEHVPVYPGCERKKTKEAKRKCMSEKLGRLIQKKFDTGIASEHGLSGIQKIDVQFKIDPTGKVTEIKTRAVHSSLEKEARRVASKIPEMKPGLQRGKPVSVIYNLPIKFQVRD